MGAVRKHNNTVPPTFPARNGVPVVALESSRAVDGLVILPVCTDCELMLYYITRRGRPYTRYTHGMKLDANNGDAHQHAAAVQPLVRVRGYIDVSSGTIPTPTRTHLARMVRNVRGAQLSPRLLRIGVETLTFVSILRSNSVQMWRFFARRLQRRPPKERTPGQTSVLNVASSQRPTCSRGSPGVLTMGIETYFIALRALRCQAALL